MHFPLTYYNAIITECREAYPREACGLLLGYDNVITRAIPSPNLAATPERQFSIDPSLRLRWQRELREMGNQERIIGCYHSHPNGKAEPSAEDRAYAVEEGFIWMIISLHHSEAQQRESMARFYRAHKGTFLAISSVSVN